MTTVIATGLLAAVAGLALSTFLRQLRQRRRAARRRIEQPNSHYAAAGVVRRMDRERWAALLDVDMHPINRAELERLLNQVDAAGVDSLSAAGRQYLDNLMGSHLPGAPKPGV